MSTGTPHTRGDYRIEARAKSGSPLPLPNLSVSEQQPGAGSSSDQTAREREPGLPILCWGLANASGLRGLRGRANDPKGPSAVVTKGDVVGQVQFVNEILGLQAL